MAETDMCRQVHAVQSLNKPPHAIVGGKGLFMSCEYPTAGMCER